MARHLRDRLGTWHYLVPVVALLAGLVFAVTAKTSDGQPLRSDRARLTELIEARSEAVGIKENVVRQLTEDIAALNRAIASDDAGVATAQAIATGLEPAAGLQALTGPGIRVTMRDAKLGPNGELPPGARPDDVVIHQSDIQGVVNAMWLAGADAISIMGERIINTSAVLCVGNTLLLDGKTYSPPFVIVALGDQDEIEQQLAEAPGTKLFLDAVEAFGLGYTVERVNKASVPEYDGSLGVTHATVIR